jgi:iron complex transport system substrate-binding protein
VSVSVLRYLLVGFLLAGLAGCGGGAGMSTPGAAPGNNAGFPMSVTGKFGTTTVPSRPVRVVAMSTPDADFALSLGIKPVGMSLVTNTSGGIQPWTKAALGDSQPVLFDVLNGDPLEQIAALRPDVILATKDYHLDRSYPDLSRIAPVVTYVTAPNSDPWQQDLTNVGTALGLADKAHSVITDTQNRTTQAATSHPELRGKTFSYVIKPEPSGAYTVNTTDDVAATQLAQLGLTLSPKVLNLPTTGLPGRAQVGTENLGLLDADLIIAVGTPNELTQFSRNPVFSQLPAVRRGAVVALDNPTGSALGFPSPLSLSWAYDHVLPRLSAAAKA